MSADTGIDIPGPMSAALHRFSRGFLPSSVLQRELIELRAMGSERSLIPRRLHVEGDVLLVTCEVDSPDASLRGTALEDLSRLRLEGACEDGTRFSARVAAMLSLEWRTARIARAVLSCDDWRIGRPAARPMLWGGITDVELPSGRGNLRLTTAEGHVSEDDYCLRGQRYTYYLIRHQRERGDVRWLVAVDPRGATELDRDIFRRDLRSIAFCFGRPFRVGVLHGLSEDGGRAGFVKIGAEEHLAGRRRALSPVPPARRAAEASWPVALFEAISRYSVRPDAREAALTTAIASYVEALHETSADGAGLKLLRGALAAARLVLDGKAVQRADRERWKSCVQHADMLKAQGGALLSNKLLAALRSAEQARASTLIDAAFSAVGLSLLQEMEDAITAVASSLLAEDGVARPDERSAAILGSVLVALVAKAVGYEGPICGWERPPFEDSCEPAGEWWPVKKSAGDLVGRFSADAPGHTGPRGARPHWPHFSESKVPIEGPVAMIASFAEELEERTDGLVIASVKPLTHVPGEPAAFDFVLAPAGKPKSEVRLLVIHETGRGEVRITDWDGEEHTLGEEERLATFLDELAHRRDTGELVRRLRAAAREPPEP
ncbi:hypothetical protein BE20_35770 [Sorangium cellulosum]|uniref:Uncharacterized protein n=1 Tax=Sorangium cellulosum TaxID=56 RepID=A0A150T1A4_SORCE|nr:hypothetical protein BE20_35770 [Sorangium cellulosum]KYG00955.1 hypothetical protein BE18_38545 [Sorangium cellulosum]